MKQFWVVGGKFVSTAFEDYAEDGGPERFGPYDTYDDARKAWFGHSMARIDECLVRYRIVDQDGAEAHPVSRS